MVGTDVNWMGKLAYWTFQERRFVHEEINYGIWVSYHCKYI